MIVSAGFFHIQHHAALDFAGVHFFKNIAHFIQRTGLHHRHHDAARAEIEGFGQILACAHQRADHFDAVEHGAGDRQIHGFHRQAHGHHAAAGAHAINGAVECGFRHGGHHSGVCADAGDFFNALGRIFFGGIHGEFRAHFFGQIQLVVVDIDSNHARVEHFGGVLHGEVAQAAGAVNGNPLACAAGLAVLDELENRQLIGNAEIIGRVLKTRLQGLMDKYDFIGDVRGLGLLQAFELVADRKTMAPLPVNLNAHERLVEVAYELGLILYSRRTRGGRIGDHFMVCPPLITTEEQVNEIIDLLNQSLMIFAREINFGE